MIETQERELILELLKASETRLLELVDGLTPAQWNFREAPDRWSTAENLEHVILVEAFLLDTIRKLLAGPAEPRKRILTEGKDPLVIGLAHSRDQKITAREFLRPAGKWPETQELIAEFCRTRAETVAFAEETDVSLRDYFFKHVAFGDLDCYQWMLLLGQHGARHARQIEQIRRDPAYPR